MGIKPSPYEIIKIMDMKTGAISDDSYININNFVLAEDGRLLFMSKRNFSSFSIYTVEFL